VTHQEEHPVKAIEEAATIPAFSQRPHHELAENLVKMMEGQILLHIFCYIHVPETMQCFVAFLFHYGISCWKNATIIQKN
jgi:hypothetical protein